MRPFGNKAIGCRSSLTGSAPGERIKKNGVVLVESSAKASETKSESEKVGKRKRKDEKRRHEELTRIVTQFVISSFF